MRIDLFKRLVIVLVKKKCTSAITIFLIFHRFYVFGIFIILIHIFVPGVQITQRNNCKNILLDKDPFIPKDFNDFFFNLGGSNNIYI